MKNMSYDRERLRKTERKDRKERGRKRERGRKERERERVYKICHFFNSFSFTHHSFTSKVTQVKKVLLSN